MISFRFHVVSITAVFLAIAIGVVVGLDLRRRRHRRPAPRTGSTRSRATSIEARDENARLEERARARAREYIDLSAEFAVTDRLTDVPVLVVAARGRRRGGRRADGRAGPPGGRRRARDRVARAALGGGGRRATSTPSRSIVGGSASDDPRGPLGRRRGRRIADELAAEPTSEDDRAAARNRARPARCWPTLEEAGFVTVDPLDDDTRQPRRPRRRRHRGCW